MERISWISMANKVKELIGFYYFIDRNIVVYFGSYGIEKLSEEVLRYTRYTKSRLNLSRATYLEYKIMILLYVNFIVSLSLNIISGKTLLDYTNLFFSNGCKKNGKIIYKWFKEKYGLRKRKP